MVHDTTLHHVGDSFAIVEAQTLQRTPTLSFRAKGVFATLRSYPEGWRFNMKHLQGLATEGREALRAAMTELREHGYVRYERVTDPETNRKMGMRILVSRLPRDDWKADRQPESPEDGFLGGRDAVSISSTGKSSTEDQEQKSKPLSPEATISPERTSSAKGKTKEPPREDALSLVEIWNENRGSLPFVKQVTNVRLRKLRTMIKQLGLDEARAVMEKATCAVAADDFWKAKQYGLDNLLAGEKYVQKAESFDAEQGTGMDGLVVGARVEFRDRADTLGRTKRGQIVEVIEHQWGIQFDIRTDENGADTYRTSHHYIDKVLS